MFKYFIVSLSLIQIVNAQTVSPIDKIASKETRLLLKNLKALQGKGCLFGHQDDLAYGVLMKPKEGFSDVYDVSGDYPALYGWDLSRRNDSMNIDSVSYKMMKKWIKDVYKRGGVNTISVHMSNPLDTSKFQSSNGEQAVKAMLPGGEKHSRLKMELDLIADFVLDLKGENGEYIPIIFRPWHEHNGDWFWWGKGSCSEEEYIRLWRFTVNYLRDVKHVHNLLYAFSPDRSRMEINEKEYLYGYPGDDFIDILGLDDYMDVGRTTESINIQAVNFAKSLNLIVDLAKVKNKIPALTETGDGGMTIQNWYTEILLRPFKQNEVLKKIAYVMVWRNARKDHHYTPYRGHAQVEDFLKFKSDPYMLFEKDLPTMYK